MFKKIILSICITLSCYSTTSVASSDLNDDIIEFQGRKKRAIEFIFEALDAPNSHLFATTDVFDSDCEYLGNVLQMPQWALDKVDKGDFVYSPYYKLEKTHLSGGDYVEIAVIIVGTRNESLIVQVTYNYIKKLAAERQ